MKKRKGKGRRLSLGATLAFSAAVISFLLAVACIVAGAVWQTRAAAREREELGDALAHELARTVGEEELVSGGTEMRERLADIRDTAGARRVYICAPDREGNTVVADSETGTGEAAFDPELFDVDTILSGGEPDTRRSGTRVICPAPIDGADRVLYVVAEFDISGAVRSATVWTATAAAAAAVLSAMLAVLYWLLVKRSVITPIKRISDAAADYSEGGNRQAFAKLRFAGSAELTGLASSFRMMLAEIEVNNMEQQELAVQEQKNAGDMALASGLNAAARPKELPADKDYPFRLGGMVNESGRALTGCFYDYFVTEGDRLCFTLGETSGEGLSQALFAVIGETTLKSHLRSGMPLEEAVSAANRQLYEMSGGAMYLSVAAGVLDGTTGRLKIINAGQCLPLLMRFTEGRFDKTGALPQVPLGQNENVSFTALELELRQGDRIFLHTEGIEDIEDQGGRPFREELRKRLNELKTRMADPAAQLRLISDAGGAYAGYSGDTKPYALMSVEYCRRDKMEAHCVVSADAEGGAEYVDFLRKQLRANDVSGKQAAETLVVADELMALCRSVASTDSRLMAECAIKDGLAVLRIRGRMGGTDPLSGHGVLTGQADFVRRSCERVLFEHGEDGDTVTAVRRIGR